MFRSIVRQANYDSNGLRLHELRRQCGVTRDNRADPRAYLWFPSRGCANLIVPTRCTIKSGLRPLSQPDGLVVSYRRHLSCATIGSSLSSPSFPRFLSAALSGGGFSNHFPRPDYQQQAVSTYLQTLGNRYKGLYKCVCSRDMVQCIRPLEFL